MSKPIDIQADWIELCRLRQACRDAATLPERVHALAEYQGALVRFIEAHHLLVRMAVAAAIERRT